MAFLEDLPPEEISQTIRLLVEGRRPLSLTVRDGSRWITFRTLPIAEHKGVIWVDMPDMSHLPAPYGFAGDQRVGVAFSVTHRKYVFATTVACAEGYRVEDGTEGRALKLNRPRRIQKLERRLHPRRPMPTDTLSRATFWLGGWEARPMEATAAAPTWSGRILNISEGGLLVRTSFEAAKYVEVGDVVGVHVMFDGCPRGAFVDGQLRHSERDGEMALMGVEFVEAAGEGGAPDVETIRQRIRQQAEPQRVT